jgi:hypothetical protein
LELKILELFLLNARGFQESSKIGLMILSFSIISYKFSKSGRKRERKGMNSNGLKPARVSPRTGKRAPTRDRFGVFAQRPMSI